MDITGTFTQLFVGALHSFKQLSELSPYFHNLRRNCRLGKEVIDMRMFVYTVIAILVNSSSTLFGSQEDYQATQSVAMKVTTDPGRDVVTTMPASLVYKPNVKHGAKLELSLELQQGTSDTVTV